MTDDASFLAAARSRISGKGPSCAGARLSDDGRRLILLGLEHGISIRALSATLADETDGTGERITPGQISHHFVLRMCKCWAER